MLILQTPDKMPHAPGDMARYDGQLGMRWHRCNCGNLGHQWVRHNLAGAWELQRVERVTVRDCQLDKTWR